MRIIRLAALAALGGIAVNTLLKSRRGAEPEARVQRRPGASARPAASPFRASRRDTPRSQAAYDAARSPNAAERLNARHPAGALGEAGRRGLGLTSPASGETESASSTGLTDFLRGA